MSHQRVYTTEITKNEVAEVSGLRSILSSVCLQVRQPTAGAAGGGGLRYVYFVKMERMYMRNILYVCLALLALSVSACRKAAAPNPDDVCVRAAKAYYDYLLHGRYDAYVDGFYRPDSIPGGYREQLIANAKMYVAQMKDDHRGLASVEAACARTDTARRVGEAFLVLCFRDSVREQIVVPMTLHGGNWMLR